MHGTVALCTALGLKETRAFGIRPGSGRPFRYGERHHKPCRWDVIEAAAQRVVARASGPSSMPSTVFHDFPNCEEPPMSSALQYPMTDSARALT